MQACSGEVCASYRIIPTVEGRKEGQGNKRVRLQRNTFKFVPKRSWSDLSSLGCRELIALLYYSLSCWSPLTDRIDIARLDSPHGVLDVFGAGDRINTRHDVRPQAVGCQCDGLWE